MSHNSPPVYLVWSLLVSTLFVFLLSHLWAFDRFRCLKWNSTGGNGTFKRVMTYSYLTSIPLLLTFAIGFCYIKYSEGYIDSKDFASFGIPDIGIIPRPPQLWAKSHRDVIFPLYLCFSICWALEIVSHLEELCFWLFLIHTSDAQSAWFRSPHFIFWAIGSCIALAGLPSVTIYLKDDVDMCEAWTFLTGAVGSLVLTLLFVPVLMLFPRFLRKVRDEGVDPSVMVRLTKFQGLNITRVIARFFFVVPLLIIAVDAVRTDVRSEHIILINPFASDLLAMTAGFGCVISSMITLLIFFPRSYEQEAGYRFRERPMTELFSQDENIEEKIDDSYEDRKGAARPNNPMQFDNAATRFDVQDTDPYAYRPSYGSDYDQSSMYTDTTAAAAAGGQPQRYPTGNSQAGLVQGARPKSLVRRPTVWEMVDISEEGSFSSDHHASFKSNLKRSPTERSANGNLNRNSSRKSNKLHPILANYTSPINVFDVERMPNDVEAQRQ